MNAFTNPSICFTALNYLNVFAIKYNKSSILPVQFFTILNLIKLSL